MKKFTLLVITLLTHTSLMAENLSDAMTQCKAESNSLKRLVCYDKLAKDLNQYKDVDLAQIRAQQQQYVSTGNATSTYNTKTPPLAATLSAEEQFGIKAEKLVSATPDQIFSAIAKISTNPFGKSTVTLENGQIWRQSGTEELPFKKGDKVFIKKGILGAFFLGKQGTNISARFRRVK